MLAWMYRSGRQGIRMWERFDGDSLICVIRRDVLEHLLRFQRSTVLYSTVSTAVAMRSIAAHLVIAQKPHAWCLVKLVIGDHNVIRSNLQNVPLGTFGCPNQCEPLERLPELEG